MKAWKSICWMDSCPDRCRRSAWHLLAESSAEQATTKEVPMSPVLLAMFDQYKIAERVRIELVRDGFPTDRVELTASCEPGRAGLEPAESPHERFVQYFRVLFTSAEEQHHPEELAKRLDYGAATITVHPRGSMETARARQILLNARTVELISHDLPNQTAQSAAAQEPRRWIIATAAFCLLFAAYLVNKQELRGTSPEDSSLQQTGSVPDGTGLTHEGHTPSPYISAVVTNYFDTYLAELHLERRDNSYARPADHDSDWWVLEKRIPAEVASCLAALPCGAYDAARTPLPNPNRFR
jgi:hypothetical protein